MKWSEIIGLIIMSLSSLSRGLMILADRDMDIPRKNSYAYRYIRIGPQGNKEHNIIEYPRNDHFLHGQTSITDRPGYTLTRLWSCPILRMLEQMLGQTKSYPLKSRTVTVASGNLLDFVGYSKIESFTCTKLVHTTTAAFVPKQLNNASQHD